MRTTIKDFELDDKYIILDFLMEEKQYELNIEYVSGEVVEIEKFDNKENAIKAFTELVKLS